MKSLLLASILATCIAPIAFAAPAAFIDKATLPTQFENPSAGTAINRRSHHCPKGAAIITARCRGV